MATARYVFGVLLVIAMPPGIVWWFLVHPFVGFWRRVGAKTTVGLMIGMGIAGAVGLFFVRGALLGRDLGTNWILVGLAVVLATGSVRIGLARRSYLTKGILAGLPELEPGGHGGKLLTEGPYARIRHPRYVEVALGVLAYALFANYVGAYVVALVTVPALHGIVLLEERELADRFGVEWEAYRARVPRYLPRRRSPASATGGSAA